MYSPCDRVQKRERNYMYDAVQCSLTELTTMSASLVVSGI